MRRWIGGLAAAGLALGLLVGAGRPVLAALNLFKPWLRVPADGDIRAVGIGDFNGDGLDDVAAASGPFGELLVFHQTDAGELEAPDLYERMSSAMSLAVGDFNADGRADVAVAGYIAGISIYLQNVAGDLEIQPEITAGDGPDALAVADLNGDGRDDLATANARSPWISVFYQQVNGTMGLETRQPAAPYGVKDLRAADMNGDGLNDLVAMRGVAAQDTLAVYLQSAEGNFDYPIAVRMTPASLTCTVHGDGLILGDVTGDGRADAVVSCGGNTPFARILVFNFAAGIPAAQEASYSAYQIPTALLVEDVDMDGRNDVVVFHHAWDKIGVFTQTAGGKLDPFYRLFSIPRIYGVTPQVMAVGDLNLDGYPDLVIADHGAVVLYHENTPDFELQIPVTLVVVAAGESAEVEVLIETDYGFAHPVQLSVTGLPEGVTYSFAENPLAPPGSTRLIFSAAETAPLGVYWPDVSGFSNGVTHTRSTGLVVARRMTTLDVTVEEPVWLGKRVQFTAQTDVTDAVYNWDFGDGHFASNNPDWHTFADLGSYTVTAYAENLVGSMQKSITVQVVDWPVSGLNIGAPAVVYARLPARFTAFISAGSNPAFAWDFGDGGQGSGAQVAHVYPHPGLYNVQLTGSNGSGQQTVEQAVNVLKPVETWYPLVGSAEAEEIFP